jgi:hypothetical protein
MRRFLCVCAVVTVLAGCSDDPPLDRPGDQGFDGGGHEQPGTDSFRTRLTTVEVIGDAGESVTATVPGAVDSDPAASGFRLVLPLDGTVLPRDPVDGRTSVLAPIELTVTDINANAATTRLSVEVNP